MYDKSSPNIFTDVCAIYDVHSMYYTPFVYLHQKAFKCQILLDGRNWNVFVIFQRKKLQNTAFKNYNKYWFVKMN